jgi:hypothetical protein
MGHFSLSTFARSTPDSPADLPCLWICCDNSRSTVGHFRTGFVTHFIIHTNLSVTYRLPFLRNSFTHPHQIEGCVPQTTRMEPQAPSLVERWFQYGYCNIPSHQQIRKCYQHKLNLAFKDMIPYCNVPNHRPHCRVTLLCITITYILIKNMN